MNNIQSYLDLDVWKKSRILVKEVCMLTKQFPKTEIFGLTDQMRRSSISVLSNIAEGSGRNSARDTLQFLYFSRGSLCELESQVYVSFDLTYITEIQLKNNLELVIECKKLLNGFINYYKNLKSNPHS